MVTPIGHPSLIIASVRWPSKRHQRPNRWKRRNLRSSDVTVISALHMISHVTELPTPPPTSSSAGNPR